MIRRLIAWSTFAVGIFGGVAAGSSAASAQSDWSVHGRIATLSGWTDNIALAPENDPIIAPPEADFFFDLRPGMLFTHATPRMINQLSYEFQANLNVDHTEANDFAHRVEWAGFFRTGPRSTVVTNVAGHIGDTGNLVVGSDAGAGSPGFVPVPGQTFRRADAFEVLRYELNQDWRTSQTLSASWARTFEDGEGVTDTGAALIGVAGDRVWSQQTLGLALSTQFIRLEQLNQMLDATQQLNTTLEVAYVRDFNLNWSGHAFAGASLITPLSEGDAGVHPVARLGVFYRHDVGFGSFQVTREVVPILFAAETAVNESAALNVGLPLPYLAANPTEPVLFLSSSAGVGRTRLIDSAGDAQSGWSTLMADGGIFYTNREPRLSIGLRYAYNRRFDDETMTVPEYQSHTVMLMVGGMWPNEPAGVVPVRGGVRVDQSDLDPTADENEAANAAERGGN